MKKLILYVLFMSTTLLSMGQHALKHENRDHHMATSIDQRVNLFEIKTSFEKKTSLHNVVVDASILSIDKETLKKVYRENEEQIELVLPNENREDYVLVLEKNDIFATGFSVTSSKPDNSINEYKPGNYYKGKVMGMENSIAAISIFEDEVIGVISTTRSGNMTLGKLENEADTYILFAENKVYSPPPFSCDTEPNAESDIPHEYLEYSDRSSSQKCVNVYLECDHDLYVKKGGSMGAVNYVTALFNTVAVIYDNENITTKISQIFVWNTADTYPTNSSMAALDSFRVNRSVYNGDLAHLISGGAPNGVGRAYVNALCNSYGYAYSSIALSFNQLPTYSWSVYVVAHEMGHNLGSYHTHDCVWNGNNTAIDGCASTGSSCTTPPIPAGGGTIMSYCHHQSVGINFNNGFGTQPGNLIRNKVNNASCLFACFDYCNSKGNNTNHEWIEEVKIAHIVNKSGNNSGYGNYTYITQDLAAGGTYDIKLTPGFSSNPYNEIWRVWIDFNQDLDFNDPGEEVFAPSASGNAVSGTFTIPTNVTTGTTRMRVSMREGGVPQSCNNFTYGEVEDYNVNIILPQIYCSSEGSNSSYEWIEKVKIGSINNTSGNNGGYAYFTSVTSAKPGESVSVELVPGHSNTIYDEIWRIWIDFNRDADFDDPGEKVFAPATSNTTVTGNFAIPQGTLPGTCIMRVSMKWATHDAPAPCEVFSYGEVEDYRIMITNAGAPTETIASDRSANDLADEPTAPVIKIEEKEIHLKVFPNPFEQNTTIEYDIVKDNTPVSLTIFNTIGEKVAVPLENKESNRGIHKLGFDGSQLPAGIYYCQLRVGDKVKTKKMILTK